MQISVWGPYRGVTGYDYVCRGFIKEWYEQGHQLHLTEFGTWSNLRAPTDIDNIINECEKTNINPDVHVNFCLLDQCQINPFCLNVCYTMFESDRICQEWVEAAKRLDLIVVPTEFNRKTFTESGINPNKVKVCGVPLDIDKIARSVKEVPLKAYNGASGEDIMKYKHRFLNCSEYISRKNIDNLLRAWCDEVKAEDNACLLLKLNSNSGLRLDYFQKKIDQLVKNRKTGPIFLFMDYLPEKLMLALYHSCTHYITASYGEGWGLSESICGILGKRVIAPKSSSFTEYLTEENSYAIMTQRCSANQDGPTARYYNGTRWFVPIFFSIRKNIRKSITEANANEDKRARLLSDFIVDNFNSVKMSNKLIKLVNDHQPKSSMTPTSVVKGPDYNFAFICKSFGTKCGIADYTHNLYHATVNDNNKNKFSANMVIQGESIQYEGILEQNNIHLVNLQLEYQFISPKRLELLLQYCNNTGIVPVVTMHTVNPRAFDYHKVLIENNAKIVVSSNRMINELTWCGISLDNVAVVPMGIDNLNLKSFQTRNDPFFRIGFFGFTYFHKGIDKLLQYMQFNGQDKQLLLLSAKPENDQGYTDKLYQLYDKVNRNNMQWIKDYINESDVVDALSTCDLIVLPYSSYGGVGVSAAVRTCLKAGVPIVGFNNEFFQDVIAEKGLINFLQSNPNSFIDWSEELNTYINEYKANPANMLKTKNDYVKKRDEFAKNYDWNNSASEYLKCFDSWLKVKWQKQREEFEKKNCKTPEAVGSN